VVLPKVYPTSAPMAQQVIRDRAEDEAIKKRIGIDQWLNSQLRIIRNVL
jgi:hypothetical protein